MQGSDSAAWATIAIMVISSAAVIIRPWKVPEAVWAIAGAALLLLSGLLPITDGLKAVGKGSDVYLFLTGMMLLSELARYEGLFDFLASHAAKRSHGSASKLFFLIYAVGTVVTIFMSNDATAVVLTPAVFAAARAAKAKPLPYLYICAFIANAASFVLPISNPANLVLFQSKTLPLLAWLASFGLPSLIAITITFLILRWTQRTSLSEPIETEITAPPLSRKGMIAGAGIGLTAVVLMAASALQIPLGLPTFITGALTCAAVLLCKRQTPWLMIKQISWGVLPLVAGLFVLVEGLDHVGVVSLASRLIDNIAINRPVLSALGIGGALAFGCNLTNNLPAGLVAALTLHGSHAGTLLRDAALVGLDLGPNFSVTGSLATILWLTALRREGETVSAWQFLKLGALVMLLALIPALFSLLLLDR